MEQTWIPAIIMTAINIIVVVVAITRAHDKQSASIELVNQDLQNHKKDHAKLEERVTKHEEKIDKKLDDIQASISQIRDLVIELRAGE